MEQRVRVNDGRGIDSRPIPIPHLRVNATTSGAADTLLTVRDPGISNLILVIKHLAVVNTTGSAATLSLNSIPSGGSYGFGNAELVAYSVAANTAVDITDLVGQFYQTGTVLKAFSGTSDALVVHGWAEEVL